MQVLVVGGTGFIGFHIVKALITQGHNVSLLCRPGSSAKKHFGNDVNIITGDLNFFLDLPFTELFSQIDAVIYAAGIDERTESFGDPYTFFYKENVTCCVNFIQKAKAYGIKQAIIIGSIFTYLDAQHPQLQLSQNHPYIRSRTAQRDHALALADNNFQVNICETPFVFGATPGCSAVAKRLINYIRIATPLLSIEGGANAISVHSLSQAIIGILEHVKESGTIAVGDENISWIELTEKISQLVNEKAKPIKLIKPNLLTELTHVGGYLQDLMGIKSGLDQKHIADIINLEAYFDTTEQKKSLQYKGGDLQQALAETVAATPDSPLISNMQRSVDWLNDTILKNF